MGISAGIAAGAAAFTAYDGFQSRKKAEKEAAMERDRLSQLASKDPPTLPDPEAASSARRKSIVNQIRLRGRSGSILSQGSPNTDTLG